MMDRRVATRVPLDTPCLLTLLVNYETELAAMAVDVSQGGVQLALSPCPNQVTLEIGTPITLKDVPDPLKHLLEGAHGKIAWLGLRCCGVKLNKELPIDPTDITDLARI